MENKDRCKSCGEFSQLPRDKPMRVGEALRAVVKQATCDDRLVEGITETASALRSWSLSTVLFCVVGTSRRQDIEAKLLEAFCTEHNVKLIKVSNCEKLLVKDGTCTKHNESSLSTDDRIGQLHEKNESTCILLKKSTCPTPEEEFLMAFYKTYTYCTDLTFPFVRIPE